MAAPKGNTYSTGRPKGAKNVKTQQWEAIGEFLVQQGSERMLNYLNSCDDKEYSETFLRILEYFKPKLARTDTNVSGDVNLKITDYAGAARVPTKKLPTSTS